MRQFRFTVFTILITVLMTSCGGYKDLGDNAQWNYTEFKTQQEFFETESGKLAYTDKGEGDVILLVHGVPSSSWLYRRMIDPLVSKGFRVIAPDMLGFGNSDSPEGYDIYSNSNQGQRLLELMESLGIQEWTQIVHDAGGAWTWEMMRQDSKKIENLVMLNTILFEDGFKPPIRLKKGFFAKTGVSLYRTSLFGDFMLNRFMNKALLDRKKLSQSEFEGYSYPIKVEDKTQGMYWFFTNIRKPFPEYEDVISNIEVPKLVIWGMADDMLRLKPQEDLMISRMNVLPENIHKLNASHFLQEERADKLVALIVDFLKK